MNDMTIQNNICLCVYIYTVTTFKYAACLNIRTCILDYLREGLPWPAQPFKHTASNSFKHTATTCNLNIRTGISYYLRGFAVWPALHIFKCCYRIYLLSITQYDIISAFEKGGFHHPNGHQIIGKIIVPR